MYRMVGLIEEEHIYTPLATVIRRRLPWMVVNLATAFLASWVVGLFEASIQRLAVLAVFTRGIALGEIDRDAGARAMLREVIIATAIGVVTGLCTAAGAYLWRGSP